MTKHDIFKLRLNFNLPLELYGEAADGRQPFVATITFAGMPSDGPVGGTEDIPGGPYRILIPTGLMQAKVEDLMGKGVFAALSLDTHEGTTRIGRFSDAWTQRFPGTEVEAVRASGFLQRNIDKDLVAKVIERARNGELGFSYDMKNAPVKIEDYNGEAVAVLLDFEWRGATILYRQTAAYQYTSLAAKVVGTSTSSSAGQTDNHQFIQLLQSLNPTSRSTQPSTAGADTGREDLEMTKEELQSLFAEQFKPITEGQKSIGDKLTAFDARLKTVEAASQPIKGVADPALTEALTKITTRLDAIEAKPTAATKSDDNQMTVKDLAASISEAVSKPLADAIKELKDAVKSGDQTDGTRRTFSAQQIETIKRYSGDFDGDDPTVENIAAAIKAVNDDARMPKSQKEGVLTVLSAMRRDMTKSNIRGGGR